MGHAQNSYMYKLYVYFPFNFILGVLTMAHINRLWICGRVVQEAVTP